MALMPIGSKVQVGGTHKGRLHSYFVAPDPYDDRTQLYATVHLDAPYWTKPDEHGDSTCVTLLVVHSDNLDYYV